MENNKSSLWLGILIGALAMLFIVNFLGNNFFMNIVSPNTCAMMHGSSTFFHHSGFWITLAIIIILVVVAFQSMKNNKKR